MKKIIIIYQALPPKPPPNTEFAAKGPSLNGADSGGESALIIGLLGP